MTWTGFTIVVGRRKGKVQRSHGNWLAIVYDSRGRLSSGEYFSYGEPGAIERAKAWCEERLSQRRMK